MTAVHNRSVMQDWTHGISFMQQSVLIASVRGPDGIKKNHVAKVLCRYLRRSFMLSAFENTEMWDPTTPGGGSFTGPIPPAYKVATRYTNGLLTGLQDLRAVVSDYLRHVDEVPHHFQLHLMHSAEILGYKHPDENVRAFWCSTYLRLVNDMHLFPESEALMDTRLSDDEDEWRAREEVTAR